MLNSSADQSVIGETGLFDDLSTAFKEDFFARCAERVVFAGEKILSQGSAAEAVFILTSGSAEITSINEDSQNVLIHVAGPGDIVGEVELLADRDIVANCIAITDVKTVVVCKELLIEALGNPTFLRNMMRLAHDRLNRDNRIKFVDQFYTVDQKLCDNLFRLSVDNLEIRKTQADLAGLLGCARQTLNRELGRLRDDGLIALEKGRVRVLDRTGLYRRSIQADLAEP